MRAEEGQCLLQISCGAGGHTAWESHLRVFSLSQELKTRKCDEDEGMKKDWHENQKKKF